MKLIQINGWCGRLNGPLRDFISREKPDFVCMQEAFAPGTKAMKVFEDQYGYVDEIISTGKFPYTFFAPAWGFAMGGETIDVGNIILSKHTLSDTKSFHTYKSYHIRSYHHALANTRIFQSCTVSIEGGQSFSLANYQGYVAGSNSQGDDISVETMRKVCTGLASLPTPLIFCGDLNVAPTSPAVHALDDLGLENLTQKHSIKTTLSAMHRAPQNDRDNVACDYIFVSQDISVKSFRAAEDIISDHKALIMEFEL